jgi:hypothetical protein
VVLQGVLRGERGLKKWKWRRKREGEREREREKERLSALPLSSFV